MVQTGKIRKRLPIVLFGTDYWDSVVDFDALVDHGTISKQDVNLVFRTDSIDQAYDYLTRELIAYNLDRPGAVL